MSVCILERREKETEDREGSPKRNRLLFLFKNSALKKKNEN